VVKEENQAPAKALETETIQAPAPAPDAGNTNKPDTETPLESEPAAKE
jgi:hypothetical protein